LDKDNSGALEPDDLINVILDLSQAHPMTLTVDKCRQFTQVFDVHGNGVIMQDEFVEFAQFLTVMNFLANSSEGQRIRQRGDLEHETKQAEMYIQMLEEKPGDVSEVMLHMPSAFVYELNNVEFDNACKEGFDQLDTNKNGSLDAQELFPVISAICASYQHPFQVTSEQANQFINFFDKDKNGVICRDEFSTLSRYIILLAYLYYQKDHKDLLKAELLMGQERISNCLDGLRHNVANISEIIPFLPKELLDELKSADFEGQCLADFSKLDADNSGTLEPEELLPIILHLSEAHHFSMTAEHCRHFVDIFDVERNGVITRAEYCTFARFMMIMAFLETEEGQLAQLDLEVTKGYAAVDDLLHMLESDRDTIHKIVPLLPDAVYADLTSDKFVMECHERFVQLDKDKTGVLRPHELGAVVVEMSAAHPYAVTPEQCTRFTAIFDLRGDGVLRPDEFLDFSRFLCIMSYLHTPEGGEIAEGALKIMSESRRIDELIHTMKTQRHNIHKVIPYLPDSLRDDLLSDHFTVECLQFFADLDKDGNGSLEPDELYPMVLALSNSNQQALCMEQCTRFTSIFDDAKTGVISKSEFVNFSRFLVSMGFLESQEGRGVLEVIKREEKNQAEGSRRKSPEHKSPQLNMSAASASTIQGPTSPAHLTLDVDFYKKKSDRLGEENEQLRDKVQQLERMMRKMEATIEEQFMKMKHQEVDLRAAFN